MSARAEASPGEVTRLLQAWSAGNPNAQEALLPARLRGAPAARRSAIFAVTARATHSSRRRWCTKPICGWWASERSIGRAARISSRWRRE